MPVETDLRVCWSATHALRLSDSAQMHPCVKAAMLLRTKSCRSYMLSERLRSCVAASWHGLQGLSVVPDRREIRSSTRGGLAVGPRQYDLQETMR